MSRVMQLLRSMALRFDNDERAARAVALVAINAVQVLLTWRIVREAATASQRRQSVGGSGLRLALLIAANALQTGLTWWIYRKPTS